MSLQVIGGGGREGGRSRAPREMGRALRVGGGVVDSKAMGKPRGSTTEIEAAGGWQLHLIGALAIVACDQRPHEPASLRHPYAPAHVGDEWVYGTGQLHPGAPELPGAQSSERIVSVVERAERLVARVRSESPGNPGATSERDLVIVGVGVSPEIGTMTTTSGPVTTRVAEGVFLPRELTAGMSWNWRQEIDAPMSMMVVEARCEVVGPAQVGTPAGQFSAVHVRCSLVNRMRVAAIGMPIPPAEHTQTEDNYYVRGIGLVRSVTAAAQGYTSGKVLLRYTVAGAPAGEMPAIAVGSP